MSRRKKSTHHKRRTDEEIAETGGLAAVRKERGLAVYTLAVKANLSPAAVLRVERGESVLADNVVAVGAALGLDAVDAFTLWLASARARLDGAVR